MSTLTTAAVTTHYEIWANRDNKSRQVQPDNGTYTNLDYAQRQAKEFNADEAARARMELRQVRERFYVVKATVTREEV